MSYITMTKEQLQKEYALQTERFEACKAQSLKLNMARGKPGADQLDLISDMPMLRMDAAGSAVTLDADKIQGGSIFYHSAPLPEQKLLKQMLDARRQDD